MSNSIDTPDHGSTHTWHDGFGGEVTAGEDLRHWAHHDLAVLRDGRIATAAPAGGLAILEPDGRLHRLVSTDTNEIHGMTVIHDDGIDLLWLADCGFAMQAGDDGQYAPAGRGTRGPRAVLVDLDGAERRSISRPDHPAYEAALYLPTHVAADEERLGGSGSVWVADGYGASLVHCFSPDGSLELTLDGTEGAGRFDCPHAVFIDRRREPRLLVADRGNARVQVYDLDGTFSHCFGEGVLTSPSAFATVDDTLVVAELNARLVLLDGDDAFAEELFPGGDVVERPGWPNALDDDARPIRPPLMAEAFNSPHGLAADADGRLLVSEWLIGGRMVELRPTPDDA